MPEMLPTDEFRAKVVGDESTALPESSTPATPIAPPEELLPRVFGRYTLRRLLGRGGMGRVFLAHDPQLDRLVALKMPTPIDAMTGWRERFLAEARSAATLTHPNVCPVYDVGEVDSQPYLTMAFINGETLASKLTREGPLAPRAAVELVRTVARAMHEAHRHGIVHRDLKPGNLMLADDARPIVMDFGLAIRATTVDDRRLTLTGVILGTPAYMPPEQAGGDHDSIGPRSDVYSLGVILFELLTGRTPFLAKSIGKLLAQIERDPPPTLGSLNPAVDEALESIVLTALAKAPAARFASAAEFADALDRYLQDNRQGLVATDSQPNQVPMTTSEYHPTVTTSATRDLPKPDRRGRWLVALLLFAFIACAAAVIYVETDYGQIVVQLSDPNAKVEVRVNGQEVTLTAEGGKPIRVRARKDQKLEVSGAEFETHTETFDVKRGDVHVARVLLKPRADQAKNPPVQAPDVGMQPKVPAKKEPLKPVVFPEKATLIEIPGWQVLTDATKDDMQNWLADRKRLKHSVMWLDVVAVTEEPLFSAIAALDDRANEWLAILDLTQAEINDSALIRAKRLNDIPHVAISLSGFANKKEVLSAALLRRGGTPGTIGMAPMSQADGALKHFFPSRGFSAQLIRPFPEKNGQLWCGLYGEAVVGQKSVYGLNLNETELVRQLEKYRNDGYRPVSVVAYPNEGEQQFAVTYRENAMKSAWEVHRNQTVADLKAKAAELSAKGLAPASITACPLDGALRYTTVWVKEPPK